MFQTRYHHVFTCGSSASAHQRAANVPDTLNQARSKGFIWRPDLFSTSNSTTLQTSSDGCLVSSAQEVLCQNHKSPYAERQLQMRNSLWVQSFGSTAEEGQKCSIIATEQSELPWADVQVPYGDNSAWMKMKTHVFADVHQRSSVLKPKKGELRHPL